MMLKKNLPEFEKNNNYFSIFYFGLFVFGTQKQVIFAIFEAKRGPKIVLVDPKTLFFINLAYFWTENALKSSKICGQKWSKNRCFCHFSKMVDVLQILPYNQGRQYTDHTLYIIFHTFPGAHFEKSSFWKIWSSLAHSIIRCSPGSQLPSFFGLISVFSYLFPIDR